MGISVSFCSRSARPAERSATSFRDTWEQYETVASLAVWARLGEPVRTKSEHQGTELKRAISVLSQREWLPNKSFMSRTV